MGLRTLTYNPTGTLQTYTVPSTMAPGTVLYYDVRGAWGQTGGAGYRPSGGGAGSRITGQLIVYPGDVLHLYVGSGDSGFGYHQGGVGGQPGASGYTATSVGPLVGGPGGDGGSSSALALNGQLVCEAAGGGGGSGYGAKQAGSPGGYGGLNPSEGGSRVGGGFEGREPVSGAGGVAGGGAITGVSSHTVPAVPTSATVKNKPTIAVPADGSPGTAGTVGAAANSTSGGNGGRGGYRTGGGGGGGGGGGTAGGGGGGGGTERVSPRETAGGAGAGGLSSATALANSPTFFDNWNKNPGRIILSFNVPPVVVVTGPSGTLTSLAAPVATWNYTTATGASVSPQSAYSVVVFAEPAGGWPAGLDGTGAVNTGTPLLPVFTYFGTSAAVSRQLNALPNGNYRVYVQAQDSGVGSQTSAWAYSGWTQNAPVPAAPIISATALQNQPRVQVMITPTGSVPATNYHVQRSLDGINWVDVLSGVNIAITGNPTAFQDRGAPREQLLYYQARAEVGAGAGVGAWSAPVTAYLPNDGNEWLICSANSALDCILNRQGPTLAGNTHEDQAVYAPEGRTDNVVVGGTIHAEEFTSGIGSALLIFAFNNDAQWQAWTAMRASRSPMLYRSVYGDVAGLEQFWVRAGPDAGTTRYGGSDRVGAGPMGRTVDGHGQIRTVQAQAVTVDEPTTIIDSSAILATEAPINIVAPVISGVLAVGRILTVTPGEWTGLPTSDTFIWYNGATQVGVGPTYTIQASDFADSLSVVETAGNSVGYGTASAAPYGPVATAPTGAPTAVSATIAGAGPSNALISFTPPTATGGLPIISYTVTAANGQTATGPSSPVLITGLPFGVAVNFNVTANNALGAGPASAVTGYVTPTLAGSFEQYASCTIVSSQPFGSYVANSTTQQANMRVITPRSYTQTASCHIASPSEGVAFSASFARPLSASPNVSINPNSAAIVAALRAGVLAPMGTVAAGTSGYYAAGVNLASSGFGLFYVTTGQYPSVPISSNGQHGAFPASMPASLPIPPAAALGRPITSAFNYESDLPLIIINTTTGIAYEIWQATPDQSGTVTSWTATVGGSQIWTPANNGIVVPTGTTILSGSGISYSALLLTAADVSAGVAAHMLAWVSPVGSGPQVAPATTTDMGSTPSGSTYANYPHEGTIFRFPPGTAISTSWPLLEQIIGTAIRDYGIVIADIGGALQVQAQGPPGGFGTSPDPVSSALGSDQEYAVLQDLPWSTLEVVNPPANWPTF
jgi:hypothetical protein